MCISPHGRPMRLTLAALLVGSRILSGAAHAALPTPGCKDSQGGGFTYVGTVNPNPPLFSPPYTSPPPGVAPVDVGAISVTTTDGPGGSHEATVAGGTLQADHRRA